MTKQLPHGTALQRLRRGIERYQAPLILVRDMFLFSVVGLNSFIMLLRRSGIDRGLKHVVCVGTVAYFVVLIYQAVFLIRYKRLHRTLPHVRRIFRLLYTALYLTATMMDILLLESRPENRPLFVYHGVLFIWTALWGTNVLWGKPLWDCLCTHLRPKNLTVPALPQSGEAS